MKGGSMKTSYQAVQIAALVTVMFLAVPKVFAAALASVSGKTLAGKASACPPGSVPQKTNSAFQPYICVSQSKASSSAGFVSGPLTIAQRNQALACVDKKVQGKYLSQKKQNAIIKACFAQAAKNSKAGGDSASNGLKSAATGYKKSASSMPQLKKVNPIEQPVPGKNGAVLNSFPGPTVFQGTPDKLPPPNP